jgi:ankyrin repeat protein
MKGRRVTRRKKKGPARGRRRQYGSGNARIFIEQGDVNEMKQYLENNHDVNEPNTFGETLLMDAVKRTDPPGIQIIELLLNAGANVNATTDTLLDNLTPLMYAVKYNNEYAVRRLLEFGADINTKNRNNMTALDMAIKGNKYNIINILQSTPISQVSTTIPIGKAIPQSQLSLPMATRIAKPVAWPQWLTGKGGKRKVTKRKHKKHHK